MVPTTVGIAGFSLNPATLPRCEPKTHLTPRNNRFSPAVSCGPACYVIRMAKVLKVHGREVLDSRGFPTVEAEIELEGGVTASAIVPSGASTGTHEALELRDGDAARFLGKGVLKAVANVNGPLAAAVKGKDPQEFKAFDRALIDADGTPNKTKLGANAILAVSLAGAKAAAAQAKTPLTTWIQNQSVALGLKQKCQMPVPLMNVINGGAHADNGLDIQEFMIVPHGFTQFREAIRAGCEVFHHLKKLLGAKGLTTAVGDEGGFAPRLGSNREALDSVCQAIEKAGYKLGTQISVALDVAASEFYKNGRYEFKDKSLGACDGSKLVQFYAGLLKDYPLVSIEDGCSEDDWATWTALTAEIGARCQLVGDDLFVTQAARLSQGLERKAANAILIKFNQVGSLSETLETMALAGSRGYAQIASHRSGESEDMTLAALAVGTGCGQIKTGSASRSERMAKYNELLRIEERQGFGFAQPFRK